MKYIAERSNFPVEAQVKASELGAEVEYLGEAFCVTHGLRGIGFLDERTLSYFDPTDVASVESVNEAADGAEDLTIEEILDTLKAAQEAELEETDETPADTPVGEENAPPAAENKGIDL